MAGLRQKNKRVLLAALACVAGMFSLCFLSLPLYQRFCAVTGLAGTPRTVSESAAAAPRKVTDRVVTVRFDTSVAPGMPWYFKPEQPPVALKVGADGFASFLAENRADEPVSGVAVYNVTPLKAGRYFDKTQCFCFSEQVLAPHQAVHMPVSFYIDPAIADDPNMDDVHTVTLSYTFFRKDSRDLETATEKFYNTDVAPGTGVPSKKPVNG
jgi:cytochrome c oxidase assembly protein subunit 11